MYVFPIQTFWFIAILAVHPKNNYFLFLLLLTDSDTILKWAIHGSMMKYFKLKQNIYFVMLKL